MNPSSTYYIMINGKPLGPIPIDKIRQQVISGILPPGTQISADGFAWKPIEMLFGSAMALGQSENAFGSTPTALVPYQLGSVHHQPSGVNRQNGMMPKSGGFYSNPTPKSMEFGTKMALILMGIAGLTSALGVAFFIIANARTRYEDGGVRGNPENSQNISGNNDVSRPNLNPDWPAIIEKTSQSVAFIETSKGTGSGVLVGKGLIATNEHVVGEDKEVRLKFPKADQRSRGSYLGSVVFCDEKRDLAIIESKVDISFLKLGKSKSLKSGEDVSILGFPGLHDGIAPFSSGRGTFSQIITFPTIQGVEWADMALSANHGNSGGPVINGNGQVVGIVSRGHINKAMAKWIEGHTACVLAEEIILAIDFVRKQKDK